MELVEVEQQIVVVPKIEEQEKTFVEVVCQITKQVKEEESNLQLLLVNSLN